MQNLETTKLTNEKRGALSAQYAAEATLRRVYANQKDDDSIPIESVIAPLEAELKKYKNEVHTWMIKDSFYSMNYTISIDQEGKLF